MFTELLTWLSQIDGTLLIWIQETLRFPVFDYIMVFYTNLGDNGYLWFFLCFFLLLHPRTRKAGFLGIGSVALGTLFTNVIIKHLVGRDRPYLILELSQALITSSDPNSFPSGHTCAAFASASAWWRTLPTKWMRIGGLFLAFLMGYSRLYIGVHYPSDVLAGAVVGWVSGWIMFHLTNQAFTSWMDRQTAKK